MINKFIAFLAIYWFKHIISNQYIYNTIFNHTNIRIRMIARAYRDPLFGNLFSLIHHLLSKTM